MSLVGRARRKIAFRGGIAGPYGTTFVRHPILWTRFVFFDRETDNFTYDLDNEDELARWVAEATGRSTREIDEYLAEVRSDGGLSSSLTQRLRSSRSVNDVPRFGRRLGWYCLLRVTKPGLVVETGTADGLGTALLARGLQRNTAEGSPGKLLSFDINPNAGWLLDDSLLEGVELVTGDSAETLPRSLAGKQVDFFIHDSDHSVGHEELELAIAWEHAAPSLVVISDNAHVTPALKDLCERLGAKYYFFRERPRRHFYPGAGIGLGLIDR